MESPLATKLAEISKHHLISLTGNFRSSGYISSAEPSRLFSGVTHKKSDSQLRCFLSSTSTSALAVCWGWTPPLCSGTEALSPLPAPRGTWSWALLRDWPEMLAVETQMELPAVQETSVLCYQHRFILALLVESDFSCRLFSK